MLEREEGTKAEGQRGGFGVEGLAEGKDCGIMDNIWAFSSRTGS